MIAAINTGQGHGLLGVVSSGPRHCLAGAACCAGPGRSGPLAGFRDSFRVVAVLAGLSFVVAVVLMASAPWVLLQPDQQTPTELNR
jgi:hypothetical protein